MTKDKVIKSKQFIFDIAASQEPTIELIQLISLSIQSYESDLHQPCDILSVIKYFISLYGVKHD